MSLKDKALLTDEERKPFNCETKIIGAIKALRQAPLKFEITKLLEAQHEKTIKAVLQSLSDIKPLGEEEIIAEYESWDDIDPENEYQMKGLKGIAQAALEDYNRQMKEMLG